MLICTMVGATFRPQSARQVVTHLSVGEEVELRADPSNEYDDTAVAVHAHGEHIGFIPKDKNAELFERLMDGEEIMAEVVAFENTLKPVLEIQ